MRDFFKNNNIPLKILSVCIAVLMWAYVVTSENPNQSYSNLTFVPQIIGTQELAEQGLMITAGQDTQYHFSLKGKRSEISKLRELGARGITVTADLSGIDTAGVFSIRPDIKTEYSATVVSTSPNVISYTVENIVSKTVPVQILTAGEADSGFRLGDVVSDTQSVEITGAESYVAQVAAAQATVDITGSKSRVVSAELVLVNAQNEPVDDTFVEQEKTAVDVHIGVDQVITVPLSVALIPSLDITAEMVTVNIEPKEVKVYGDPSVLKNLTKLTLGTIDLAQVVSTNATIDNLSIKLPPGVSLLEGENAYPVVTLTIDDTSDTTIDVREIELNDQNQSEQKPAVSLLTTYITVEVKGSVSALKTLTADDIRVTATFDSSVLGTGTHTVPVEIEILQTGDFEIVNTTENVTIQIEVEDTNNGDDDEEGVPTEP